MVLPLSFEGHLHADLLKLELLQISSIFLIKLNFKEQIPILDSLALVHIHYYPLILKNLLILFQINFSFIIIKHPLLLNIILSIYFFLLNRSFFLRRFFMNNLLRSIFFGLISFLFLIIFQVNFSC